MSLVAALAAIVFDILLPVVPHWSASFQVTLYKILFGEQRPIVLREKKKSQILACSENANNS